jgi:hypothetical protein
LAVKASPFLLLYFHCISKNTTHMWFYPAYASGANEKISWGYFFMARADTDNGHGQGGGRDEKLKLVNRLNKEEARKKGLAAIAQKMLKEKLNVETFGDVIIEVRKRRIAQPFVRRSRANYLEAIALALALYYAMQNEKNPIDKLKRLLTGTRYRVTKRTSAAQITVRAVIDYGKTDAERQANRRTASRDAAAVNHLADRGVLPDEVVALGKRMGEGLEAWGRAKRRPPTETKRLDSSAPEASRNERKAGNGPGGVLIVADDATKIAVELRQKVPLFCRKRGDKQTVWALVPPIKLEDTDPVTKPKRTRTLLAAALKDYAAQLRLEMHPESLKTARKANPADDEPRRPRPNRHVGMKRPRNKSLATGHVCLSAGPNPVSNIFKPLDTLAHAISSAPSDEIPRNVLCGVYRAEPMFHIPCSPREICLDQGCFNRRHAEV